jgi:DNA processing protein
LHILTIHLLVDILSAMSALSAQHLPDSERADRLRLARTTNIGPITFRRLMARFTNAGEAIRALPDLLRRGGRDEAPRLPTRAEAEDEIAALARLGGRFLALGEPGYPAPLAAIEDAPPLIALRGDPAILERPAVAIVGARNASAAGRHLAETIARDLGPHGLVVVSGLARGIDAAAHQGALASGTVAVFAGGVDVVYPPEHGDLAAAILENGGAVLSEMPLGTEPQARHFPRRNRLVSGLSKGVLVVEAALKSGSLSTARFALEQGREVMAVPGSPLDPRCKGSNHLLREGAGLVECAADLLAHLGFDPHLSGADSMPAGPAPTGTPLATRAGLREAAPCGRADESGRARQYAVKECGITLAAIGGKMPAETGGKGSIKAEYRVTECLGPVPVPVDELVRRCQMSAPVVRAALLDLELAGRLERHPGDRVSLLPA